MMWLMRLAGLVTGLAGLVTGVGLGELILGRLGGSPFLSPDQAGILILVGVVVMLATFPWGARGERFWHLVWRYATHREP
jgi:hypothetical protein